MTAQSMEALRLANAVRLPGAQIRRELAALDLEASRLRCAELLENPPIEITWMPLEFLLRAMRQTGSFKAARIIATAELLPSAGNRRIRALTERQRLAVAAVLRGDG